MQVDLKLTDSNGFEWRISGDTTKERLIEFITKRWTGPEGERKIDPFSEESRLHRLETELGNLKAHLSSLEEKCGFDGPYDSGTPLTNRIEYLEDWRRDQVD